MAFLKIIQKTYPPLDSINFSESSNCISVFSSLWFRNNFFEQSFFLILVKKEYFLSLRENEIHCSTFRYDNTIRIEINVQSSMHGSIKYTKLDLHFVLGRRAVCGILVSAFSTAILVMTELSDEVVLYGCTEINLRIIYLSMFINVSIKWLIYQYRYYPYFHDGDRSKSTVFESLYWMYLLKWWWHLKFNKEISHNLNSLRLEVK